LEENNMNARTTAIAASFLALTSAGALAAEFPKSGSAKATGYETYVTLDALDGWEADFQPDVFVQTGLVRSEKEGSPFDKTFLRCVGQEAMIAGAYKVSGTCTETDKDGDKISIAFETGTFTYVSGTGKYKGITGGGTSKSEIVFQGPKNGAMITSYEKHWEIK
jgi:hypothetical protein